MEGMDEGHPTFDGPDEEAEVWLAQQPHFSPAHHFHDLCPPGHDAHIDTGGCDHRYHCHEHHECVDNDYDDGCVLEGARRGVSPLREGS